VAILSAGGGLSDILLVPGLGGTIAVAPLEDITLWSAESGGTQWTSVQWATSGQEWPAGVGQTDELGRVPSVGIDVALADTATVEVWAQRQARPGRRYRLSTGTAATGSVLTDLTIPGSLTMGEAPDDVAIRAGAERRWAGAVHGRRHHLVTARRRWRRRGRSGRADRRGVRGRLARAAGWRHEHPGSVAGLHCGLPLTRRGRQS
jgi:hypothetical protein